MSAVKSYQKSLKEASKYKRLEIEVLLSRYLETFEFDSTSGRKPDININELSDVLFSLYAITQTVPSQSGPVCHTQILSEKEIDMVFKIFTYIIENKRQQLIVARSLCESILINTDFFRAMNLNKFSDKQIIHCLDFLSPKMDSGESLKRIVNIFHSNQFIEPYSRCKCVIYLTRAIVSEYFDSPEQIIDTENASGILNWIIETLQSTEVIQPIQPYFIGDPEPPSSDKKALKLVTELDGSQCRDQFTVLNTGRCLSPSQQIHMELMPYLKAWVQICSKLCGEDSSIITKVLNYSGRLLDQIEINIRYPSFKAVVYASLSSVLDILLCSCTDIFVPKFYLRCSTLFQQSMKGELPPSLAVKLCRFLRKHAESMGKTAESMLNNIFIDLLSQKYSNSDFCNEIFTLLFCEVHESSNKMSPTAMYYFPNILKILIWNPRAYLSEFLDLIPSFLSSDNCLELFYYLIDLPCIAATMELYKKLSSQNANASSAQLKQIWDNPINQQYFSFLMRRESGIMGDTLSKIETIHSALELLSKESRVLFCYEVSAQLLQLYFTLLFNLSNMPADKIGDFVPIILDRSTILYGSNSYKSNVLSIFSNALHVIFQNDISLVFRHFDDIHAFISESNNISACQTVYLTLLFMVSCNEAFASDPPNQVECMSRLYDTLECLVYEILTSDASELSLKSIPIAFWSLLITCISKIASVIQDLIPRCSLVLSKIKQNLCDISKMINDASTKSNKTRPDSEQLRCLSLRIDEFSQLLSQNNLGRNFLANSVLQESSASFDKPYFTTVLKTIDLIIEKV